MKKTEKLFELMGISVGDGCLSITKRYKEYAVLGDMTEEKEYYESHVVPLFNEIVMMPLLNKKIVGKTYPTMGVFGFLVFNPKIFNFFTNLGFKTGPKTNMKLSDIVTKAKPHLQRAFLRGLFDTDGSIFFEKNYSAKHEKHNRPKIKLGTTSKIMKEQIKQMCSGLGIKVFDKKPHKGKRDKNIMYELVIYRKSDIEKWIKDIGFNNPKHKTKVEIWRNLGYCPPKTDIATRKAILKGCGGGDSNSGRH